MEKEKILYQSDNGLEQSDYIFLSLLLGLMIASLSLCDVFIFKSVDIFGYTLALSGCIFPITSLLMMCINEVYGHKKAATSLIVLVCVQLFFLTGLVLLPHAPSPVGYAPEIASAYKLIFKDEWRVFISSPIDILVTLYLSSIINSRLKTIFLGKYLLPRLIFTSIISMAVLVAIIYLINFWGILSFKQILQMQLDTYIYKVIMSITAVYLSVSIIYAVKTSEKRYVFDYNVNYSPLRIFSRKNNGVNLYDEFCK